MGAGEALALSWKVAPLPWLSLSPADLTGIGVTSSPITHPQSLSFLEEEGLGGVRHAEQAGVGIR